MNKKREFLNEYSRRLTTLGLMGGGGGIPPSWTSDSFNRADAVTLGSTDNQGDAAYMGGVSRAWVDLLGTWGITSNAAKPATLGSGVARSGVDAGYLNAVTRAKITRASGFAGIFFRGTGAIYLRAYHDGTSIKVDRVSGGATNLLTTAITHAAGAEILVVSVGNVHTVYYNGVLAGEVTDTANLSGTQYGLYSSSLLNTADDFAHREIAADFAAPFVRLYKEGDTLYRFRAPITGDDADTVAQYRIKKYTDTPVGWSFAPLTWHIDGLRVIDLRGVATTRILGGEGSAWEYAGKIGIADDAEADFDFYGTVHGAELLTDAHVVVDGRRIELSAIETGRTLIGQNIKFVQAVNTYLPKDKATVIGASSLTHSLTGDLLDVAHSHTYSPGYQIYNYYSAMLPTTNADSAGIDTYKVGDNLEAARVYDGAAKNLNSEAATMYGRHSSAHTYKILMTLPDGGPDIAGDWSKSGNYKTWFQDLGPNPGGNGKFYVNYVDSQFAGRVTAEASSHRTRYQVVKE